jgi:hypothetical protein
VNERVFQKKACQCARPFSKRTPCLAPTSHRARRRPHSCISPTSMSLQVCIGHCTTLVPAPSKPMMRHHTPFFMVCLARILTDGVAVVSPVRDKVDAILADLRACKDKGKLSSGEASSFSGRLGWLSSSTYGRIGRAGTRIRMIRAGGVVAFRTRRSESGGPRAHTLPERPWMEKST